MNIIDFAKAVLAQPHKRKESISNLEKALKFESKWTAAHKAQVESLLEFLKSDSDNIDDLQIPLVF